MQSLSRCILTSSAHSRAFVLGIRLRECRNMARVTVTYSISLPPEMAAEIEEIRKKEQRTRSELLREALRRYISSAKRESTT